MGRFGAGQPVRRVEDQRFLTGRGHFTDDIDFAGQAHAFVLRSPHAHARLRTIDIDAARSSPGVLAVLVGADLAADGIGGIPCAYTTDEAMKAPFRPALATDRVVHVGEAVAVVVAETLELAKDAAELVDIDYDPLPAVADSTLAIAPGAPELWPECPGNVCFTWETGDEAETSAAFAKARHVVALDLVNNRIAPTAMEPRAAIGSYVDGRFTLHSGSQGSHTLRGWLARHVFKVPKDAIRVVSPDVGGGFGMRIFLFPEHVLVLWAAKRLGRPVKWVGDRSESFLADTHGRDHVSHAELALNAQGKFLGLRVSTVANLGAYLSQYGAFIPTEAGSAMLAGVYATPAIHVRVRGVMTNTAPVDAYRGAGRPEAAYLVERMVDCAARQLGLTPDEIRRRNFIPPDAMPFRTPLGNTYDSGDFARNMDDAMARARWADFPARRSEAAARGRLRGIGMSTYIESCGGGGDEGAEIRMDADGFVTILIGTQSTGQGHETAYAQIAADQLGIPIERVRVVQGDTDVVKDGRGTGGSRSLPVGGVAVGRAVDELVASARRVAAHLLQAEQVDFAGGRFTVHGSERSIELMELAALAADPSNLPEGVAPGLAASARFEPPASTFPNGCHVCELEVDPETGTVAIVGYTIVDDFGVVLNPLLLAGQVYGGTVQGIGQALMERAAYDPESAQLVSGTFLDYAVPHAADIPAFQFATNEVPCRTNPFGIKGAGEAGAIGAPPAVINALVDALAHLGIRHIDMPATPLAIWQVIRAAQSRAA